MPGDPPVFLLDGNSLVYRAYFALPDTLATSKGQVTNAVHGFVTMVLNVLRDFHPSGLVVAFDRPEPTFRDAMISDYKANRPDTPDDLIAQFALVRQVLDALGVASVDVAGYEADDILATLATQARDAKRRCVVVTGDRDSFQLVEDPYVGVLYTRKGLSDTVLYDEAGITERTGVSPSAYPWLAALRGDPSDNLPGVPGVGEKTAARLLNTYGDLDGIYAHLDQLTPKLRESLASHEDQVRSNARLIPLAREVPVPTDLASVSLPVIDPDAARRVFAELEMRSLWRRVQETFGTAEGGPAQDLSVAASSDGDGATGAGRLALAGALIVTRGDEAGALSALACIASALAGAREASATGQGEQAATSQAATSQLGMGQLGMGASWEGMPGRSDLVGLALVTHGAPAVWLEGSLLATQQVRAAVADLLAQRGDSLHVVCQGAKELMRSLMGMGVDLPSLAMDPAVAAFLLEPDRGTRSVAELARTYADLEIGPEQPARAEGRLDLQSHAEDGQEAAAGTPGGASDQRAATDLAAAAASLALEPALGERLEEAGLARLYQEVENPLVRVLARMEVTGIAVDAGALRQITEDLEVTARALETEVQDLAGERFNVNSTPQLRQVLYEHLKLSPGRRTKTGYSTDAATLAKLSGAHPVVDALLRYREVEKLRSTYGESLLKEVCADGRIHATFNQTVARTGRLSSDRPNLHNIPVRTAEGRRLREVFIPGEGFRFLVADYDQVELRVIAHLSGDPGLVAAFSEGRDVHRSTAAAVFGVAEEDVTSEQRNRAKMVGYGLAYGMEPYGLARRLNIPTSEAQEILDGYFRAFPAVHDLMETSVAEAREKGYTQTLLGRRRPLPELHSRDRSARMAAERQAMNAGIQGLAADLFKLALVRLDAALERDGAARNGPPARLVLQVHDEVIVEVPRSDPGSWQQVVTSVMEGVGAEVGLKVPLKVSSAWGDSWAEAKDH